MARIGDVTEQVPGGRFAGRWSGGHRAAVRSGRNVAPHGSRPCRRGPHGRDSLRVGVREGGDSRAAQPEGCLNHHHREKETVPTDSASARSLTSRFRAHAPQQCALSRRSRVTQVASEYPAMLRRSNLMSGGSFASARPLGTVRTLYPDILSLSRGSCDATATRVHNPDTEHSRSGA